MFDKQQIMEFKEAFNIMDTNEDGVVDAKDLEETFQRLGKYAWRSPLECWTLNSRLGQPISANQIEAMVNEAPGPINFTVFLTLMADKLTGTDPENVIINAFAAFDEKNKGTINADCLRECMTTMGDRFTDDEVWPLLSFCFIHSF